ncbi:MAG: hypothetical protein GY862_25480 [Gammaproteobacteria bacterium]|nr:hypothetical protein [Gammaproteobacteria bacterium]
MKRRSVARMELAESGVECPGFRKLHPGCLLKRWYGEKYHQQGLQQLSDYLDIYSLKKGYLLIYDFNKGKSHKEKQIQFQDKEIFAVWV